MPRLRIALALLGATLSASALAATQPPAQQPEFTPLRGKDPSRSSHVEKPRLATKVDIKVRTEMHAVVGPDGQVRFECSDASHRHPALVPSPLREEK